MSLLEHMLYDAAHLVTLGLDAVAVLLAAVGAAVAAVSIIGQCMRLPLDEAQARGIYVLFARWLVGALTFQLGADIVETTIAPGWEEIGRMAAVAAIRTFLTYFLDRDLDHARNEQRAVAQEEIGSDVRSTKVQ